MRWDSSLLPGFLGISKPLSSVDVVGYGALSLWILSAFLLPEIEASVILSFPWLFSLVLAGKGGNRVLLGEADVMFVFMDDGSC